MIEAICRLYIALVVVIGGVIAAPVPCEHVFKVDPYNPKCSFISDSALKAPGAFEHFCINCGRSQRELCQHDFEWITDGISSGDSYTVTGGHQHCKKCGFETPHAQYYFQGKPMDIYPQMIYK